MPTNVFWSSLAPQLLTAWPYLPIHPTSQSTSHISLIKFNMYFLNIFQCGVCPEAWSTYLGYTLKGNWFFSQQVSNTQTPQLVVDSVPTSLVHDETWVLWVSCLLSQSLGVSTFSCQIVSGKYCFLVANRHFWLSLSLQCLFLWRSFNSEGRCVP